VSVTPGRHATEMPAIDRTAGGILMDAPHQEFALVGSLEELKAKGRIVVP